MGDVEYKGVAHEVVAMWKETAINHKLNQKLNPIMQVKSIINLGVDPAAAVKNFDKQMSVVDPTLRPQGKAKARLVHFVATETRPGQALLSG